VNKMVSTNTDQQLVQITKQSDSIEDQVKKTKKDNRAWKCYRCDLIFNEESHGLIHNDISNHHIQQIQGINCE